MSRLDFVIKLNQIYITLRKQQQYVCTACHTRDQAFPGIIRARFWEEAARLIAPSAVDNDAATLQRIRPLNAGNHAMSRPGRNPCRAPLDFSCDRTKGRNMRQVRRGLFGCIPSPDRRS
jgi:hypothetical protein